ncbi:hypothetical protein [Dysgonomonas capnocytophagoides]|uniref:hypothetical protein n=1 Tax=Dysgonomonas capnocytophagoides TaxID=45254 RepID=UPI00399678B2
MLISKDENIKTSPVYVGYAILQLFRDKKTSKLSIFEISQGMRKNNIKTYRQLVFGLTFLYATALIDFKEPHIYLRKQE